MLVDAHCHLDPGPFPEGPAAVLERAHAAGVHAFVVVGVSDRADAEAALALARGRSDVVVTAGVHPHDAARLPDGLRDLESLLSDDLVVAVGEVGLDFHYDFSPRPVQEAVFRAAIALSRRLAKPIVVHTRSAPSETLGILAAESARDVGGVIHCFSEDRPFASAALDLGFDLSFSGIVTFKNARAVQEVAAWAPLDRILVETDSPYLAPVPMRGRVKRCEPAYVVHTAQRIAELRGMAFEDLALATTENACRRYGPALARAVRAAGRA
jgi:TatD DNase family protein